MNHTRISAFALILVAAAFGQDGAQSHLAAGKRLIEAGNYPEAANELSIAEQADPSSAEIHRLLGRALLNTGDPDQAAAEYRMVIARAPDDFEANLRLSQILVQENDAISALPHAQRALSAKPASTEAKLACAESLAASGQFDKARPLAESAASLLPNSAEAHQALAAIYSGLRMNAEAEGERALAEALLPADPGPKPGEVAPDFSLNLASGGAMMHLSDYKGKSPVVLVFGSYSCPNFRSSTTALKDFYKNFSPHIAFFTVYIREAHAQGQWQSGRNTREGVDIKAANTMADKEQHAMSCSRQLHLPFPALVDELDGKVETAYNAWPSRAYIIGLDGKVLYQTRLTQLDFHPDEMAAVLKKVAQ